MRASQPGWYLGTLMCSAGAIAASSLGESSAPSALLPRASAVAVHNDDWSDGLLRQDPQADEWTGLVVLERLGSDGRSIQLRGAIKGAAFGAAAHVGDVNGDGIADLLVGAPQEGNGVVYVFLGPLPESRTDLTTADASASMDMDDPGLAGFGAAITLIPDVDGDGLPEIVVRCATEDAAISAGARDVVISSKYRSSIALAQFSHPIELWQIEALRTEALGGLASAVDQLAATSDAQFDGRGQAIGHLLQGGCSGVGDFDHNGTVDGQDLGSLLGSWGSCSGCPQDLNGSGTVDGADLGLLMGHWGPCDSDGDGMSDNWETSHGLNPCDPSDGNGDPDADGLTNEQEYAAGSNPGGSDTDGDGTPDGGEVLGGSDPNDASDGGEGPNSSNVLYVMLKFGDHSCHNSDTWAMKFGDVTYSFPDALAANCLESVECPCNSACACSGTCNAPWSCDLSAPREKGPIAIDRGKSYEISMVWLATSYNYPPPFAPDYDWTCLVDLCDKSGGDRKPLVYLEDYGTQDQTDDRWLPVGVVDGVYVDDPNHVLGQIFSMPNSNPTGVRIAHLRAPNLNLLMDSNRNATIDADGSDEKGEDQWTYGATGHGAIILCNNDDDDGGSPLKPDCDDSIVNGSSDVNDLAPLKIKALGAALPSGHKAFLKVTSGEDHVRIFNARAANATEVIGPSTTSHEYEIPMGGLTGSTDLEYGIEAIHYARWPDANWDGLATLQLSWRDAAGAVKHEDVVQVRVAPWLMTSHLDQVTHVYVTDKFGGRGSQDPAGPADTFPARLNAALSGTNLTATVISSSSDCWAQDRFEVGFHSIPGGSWNPVILISPRQWSPPTIREYVEQQLLGSGTGVYASHLTTPNWSGSSTRDSFGNLECFPAVGNLSCGAMVHGSGMLAALQTFLHGQVVQVLSGQTWDTSWLAVGHVDEFMSVQSTGSGGWRVILASAAKGVEILDNIAANGGYTFSHRELWDLTQNGQDVGWLLIDSARRAYNLSLQATVLNPVKAQLNALGVTVVEVPAYFYQDGNGKAGAALCNMVNMLNVNGVLIVPDPKLAEFRDAFEAAVGTQTTIRWIDCLEYHWDDGQVHCGTNTRRTPRAEVREWWKVVP